MIYHMNKKLLELNKNNSNIIGLYFSGEYCKFCKEFTPFLIENYNKFLDNDIDIIYISSDKTIEQYNNYTNDHPWNLLSYDEIELRKSLREQFDIKTIPALLFFDINQNTLLECNGRNINNENFDDYMKTLKNLTNNNYDSDDNDF